MHLGQVDLPLKLTPLRNGYVLRFVSDFEEEFGRSR